MIRHRSCHDSTARSDTEWFALSADTVQVLDVSEQISALSDGAFDVSVGPLVELWGFGASERQEKVPSAAQISEALTRVGYKNIQLRQKTSGGP